MVFVDPRQDVQPRLPGLLSARWPLGGGGSVWERKQLRQLGWAGAVAVSKTQTGSALFFFIFIVG